MKILVAEDDTTNALILKRILTKAAYNVTVVHNGTEALAAIKQEAFDVLLTDWMMPEIDGIELIRQVRQTVRPVPIIIVITALVSDEARTHALTSGADDYLAKPYQGEQLLDLLGNCFDRKHQPAPSSSEISVFKKTVSPPCIGVVIAASTRGPKAITKVIHSLGHQQRASYFVVLHGPAWAMKSFAKNLQRTTELKVNLARDGVYVVPGEIYIAPANRHLIITPNQFKLRLVDDPPENYVRPSADPLLRSAARAFGRYCIAIVMTGLGRDGASGASHVANAGGVVIAQEPATTVAPSMPRTVIEMGIAKNVVPLTQIALTISRHIHTLSDELTLIKA